MTARALAAPTTTWDIRLVCDTNGCNRSIELSVSALTQKTAHDKVRANAKKVDGWTSDTVTAGEGRARGFNVVDRCRSCANQKAGWQ